MLPSRQSKRPRETSPESLALPATGQLGPTSSRRHVFTPDLSSSPRHPSLSPNHQSPPLPALRPYPSSPPASPLSVLKRYSYEDLIGIAQQWGPYALLPTLSWSLAYARRSGTREAPWYTPWMLVLLIFFSFNIHDGPTQVLHAIPFPQLPIIADWTSAEDILEAELRSSPDAPNAIAKKIASRLSTRIPDFVHKLFSVDAKAPAMDRTGRSIKKERTILIVEVKGATGSWSSGSNMWNALANQNTEQAQYVFRESKDLDCVAYIVAFGELFHYGEWYRDEFPEEVDMTEDGSYAPSSPIHIPNCQIQNAATDDNAGDNEKHGFTKLGKQYESPLRVQLEGAFGQTMMHPKLLPFDEDEGERMLIHIGERLKEIHSDLWDSADAQLNEEDDDDGAGGNVVGDQPELEDVQEEDIVDDEESDNADQYDYGAPQPAEEDIDVDDEESDNADQHDHGAPQPDDDEQPGVVDQYNYGALHPAEGNDPEPTDFEAETTPDVGGSTAVHRSGRGNRGRRQWVSEEDLSSDPLDLLHQRNRR